MTTKMMTTTLTFFASAMLVMLTAACGNNTNPISSNSNYPGAGVLGANVDIKNCQIGQSYTAQYGCLNRGMCQSGSGLSQQTGACVPGQLVTGAMKFGASAGTRHFGTLAITNQTQMALLLQTAGLCNSAYSTTGTFSVGTSMPCTQFTSRGSFIAITSYSGSKDNINVTIGAGTPVLSYDLASTLSALDGSPIALYGTNIGGFSTSMSNAITLSQQAHNFSYNNGNGMQIVGVTASGEAINFMILIDNGNLGLDHIKGKLVYLGVEVANVTLDRF